MKIRFCSFYFGFQYFITTVVGKWESRDAFWFRLPIIKTFLFFVRQPFWCLHSSWTRGKHNLSRNTHGFVNGEGNLVFKNLSIIGYKEGFKLNRHKVESAWRRDKSFPVLAFRGSWHMFTVRLPLVSENIASININWWSLTAFLALQLQMHWVLGVKKEVKQRILACRKWDYLRRRHDWLALVHPLHPDMWRQSTVVDKI